MPDTYRISELDPESDDWEPQHTGLTLWEVRAVLRKWYGGTAAFGMSHLQVKAETHERPAKRFEYLGYEIHQYRRLLQEPAETQPTLFDRS